MVEDINRFELSDGNKEMTGLYEEIYKLVSHLVANRDKSRFKILKTIILNLCRDPNNEKLRTLKFSNENIRDFLLDSCVCDFVIHILKFTFEDFDGTKTLRLYGEFDKQLFNESYNYLSFLGEEIDLPETNKRTCLGNSSNTQPVDSINEITKSNKSSLQANDSNKPSPSTLDILKNTSNIRIENSQKYDPLPNKPLDIKDILKSTSHMRIKNPDNPQHSNISTLSDYAFVNRNNPPKHGHYNVNESIIPSKDSSDGDLIGKQCLHYTNEFRKKNGLGEVKWDPTIWAVCLPHSRNMATGKEKFSHNGFNARINSLPNGFQSACENIFMCSGGGDIARMAVNGWINSPGHRKNLLSNSTYCAIASYQNNYGEYYVTQIFVNR